jgi:heat-inducible transcriptional repressor
MDRFSERQKELLLTIIKEFIETAEAVGSISLQNKYNFDLSPATIRNEMSSLGLLGYLYQKNMSSGRIPTTKGWRFFVDYLKEMGFDDVEIGAQDEIRSVLNKVDPDPENLIRKSVSMISRFSVNAEVAVVDGKVIYSGLSELVEVPEFRDTDNLKRILHILEDYSTLSEMMNRGLTDEDINVLIGEESGEDEFSEYAIIFNELRINGVAHGYLAIIGPNRMAYNKVIPLMQFTIETIRRVLARQ